MVPKPCSPVWSLLADIMQVRFHTKLSGLEKVLSPRTGLSKDACELDASEKVTQLLCVSIFLTVQCRGGSLQARTTPSLVCIPIGSKDPEILPMLSKRLTLSHLPDRYVGKHFFKL